jgi:predicted MFS family arabinose efflux permease
MRSRALVPLLALCCGITVANIYVAQPLLTLIAEDFGVSAGAVGTVATLGQLGYALGLLLFVPLGDVLARRPLLGVLLAASIAGLAVAAGAPTIPVLMLASLALSAATVVPQLLVPLTAELTAPERRGRVLAAIQVGILSGVIAGRVVSGVLGEEFGWRTAYVVAAVLTAVTGLLALLVVPPKPRADEPFSYPRLLGSLVTLLRAEPVIRQACLLQALVFGTFILFWSTLVFLLTAEPYGFDAGTAALYSLFGLVSALAAPFIGRLVDRVGALTVIGGGIGLGVVAAVLFAFGQSGIAFVIVAIVVLNVGLQANQIANQARIFAARPDARNRANTVYMVSAFGGGSIGAALGTTLYDHTGWHGVGIAGVIGALLAAAAWVRAAGPVWRATRVEERIGA